MAIPVVVLKNVVLERRFFNVADDSRDFKENYIINYKNLTFVFKSRMMTEILFFYLVITGMKPVKNCLYLIVKMSWYEFV